MNKLAYVAKWKREHKERMKALRHADYMKHHSVRRNTLSNAYAKSAQKPSYRYSRLKAKCKSVSWELDITFPEYVGLLTQGCYYCQKSLIGSGEKGLSLDRKNNSLGYLRSNVLPACGDCNVIRHDILTVEETVVAIRAVMAFRYAQGFKS